MAYDYETYANAAKALLQNSMGQNICALMSHLMAYTDGLDWEEQDILCSAGSVTEPEENQYRIVEGDRCVDIVAITDIDQDDDDADVVLTVTTRDFCQHLWSQLSPAEQKLWLDRFNPDDQIAAFDPTDDDWCDDLIDECSGSDIMDPTDLAEYLKVAEPKWYHSGIKLLGEDDEVEATDREVYEYWLVDDYAKRKLESVGEKVIEILDLKIWCRTCTGQSFWYDSCMQTLGKQYAAE